MDDGQTADTRGRGYFTGCSEGKTLECAVQGRFKRRLRFDEVNMCIRRVYVCMVIILYACLCMYPLMYVYVCVYTYEK